MDPVHGGGYGFGVRVAEAPQFLSMSATQTEFPASLLLTAEFVLLR
ncbi:hypothetical protein [Actinoplanes ianthinogenes]|nr:hypothetical protein [Actinoplanes ianthinogenes]